MTSSDTLLIAKNCLLGENWIILTSISVISNSMLDFGVLFSTSYNLTQIHVKCVWINDLSCYGMLRH